MKRRAFVRMLGFGAVAAVAPAALLEEPRRRIWAVPSNAPVGSRVERAQGFTGLAAWLPSEPYDGEPLFGLEGSYDGVRFGGLRIGDAVNFEVGQRVHVGFGRGIVDEVLEYEHNLDATLRRLRGDFERELFDTVTIVGVDLRAGTITLSGAPDVSEPGGA